MTTDALGNVNVAPGGVTVSATTTHLELLASTIGYSQDGVVLAPGQGVLAVGTPLAEFDDGTYGAVGGADNADNRAISTSVTFTDTGDIVTFPSAHGLVVGDRVQFASVTTTTGISANTPYYVKTAPSGTTVTLSTTSGGSTLALTTDGTGGAATQIGAAQTSTNPSGFLRHQVDTGNVGDIPKFGNRVYKGTLKYSRIKAANGGVDLTSPQLTALAARIDTDKDYLIF